MRAQIKRKEVFIMNKNDQQFIAQKIRAQYTEKEFTELDALRALDAKVKRPANLFAYSYGTAGSLVLGTGMCLAMQVIGSAVIPGVAVGCAGIAMVSSTYALYKKLLSSRREKYKGEINALSEKILQNENTSSND